MDSMIIAFTSWLSFGPNIAAIFVIGTLCNVIRRVVLGSKADMRSNTVPFKGWRAIYNATYKAQAIIIGVLFGLVPGMPVPEAFAGDGIGGVVLNYAGDGAAAMVVYAIVVGNARNYIDNQLKKRVNP